MSSPCNGIVQRFVCSRLLWFAKDNIDPSCVRGRHFHREQKASTVGSNCAGRLRPNRVPLPLDERYFDNAVL